MSYKSSEGSTYASTGFSGPLLLGAVGSIIYDQIPISGAASGVGATIVNNKVLPKGVWLISVSLTPVSGADHVISASSIVAIGGVQVFEAQTAGSPTSSDFANISYSYPFYSDGEITTDVNINLSATSEGGAAWSTTAVAINNVITYIKIA
jgi:hypothetical protein